MTGEPFAKNCRNDAAIGPVKWPNAKNTHRMLTGCRADTLQPVAQLKTCHRVVAGTGVISTHMGAMSLLERGGDGWQK
ncbi:hypothetical protein ROBYS_37840 [Roseobacter sp. OBYS 0001]|nr:hypothetical protein ROBYS_37840 [Roseobacter sp. OBYS 0001]